MQGNNQLTTCTSAWYMHQIHHKKTQIQSQATSTDYATTSSFAENFELSLQSPTQDHKLRFLQQYHTRTQAKIWKELLTM